ncbi:MAG: exonuclease subunit SbcD [Saprospiraceae bacterium]|nr:exonuclease subunit SbcD [Saprospiraceae bacterium]
MKIIHTADWHLGKELHQTTLDEDHRLFIAWLITYIADNQIDVVLISGDIFDHANPSNEARKMYFGFLTQMAAQKVQVVITGGNHDSITMLESGRDLLGLLNVHVGAGMPEDKENPSYPYKTKKGR